MHGYLLGTYAAGLGTRGKPKPVYRMWRPGEQDVILPRVSGKRKELNMPPYHILSLDGGGIRGLLTAILLERLEAAVPGFLSKIDLYAGTSTGGILALGLAYGVTPTAARDL